MKENNKGKMTCLAKIIIHGQFLSDHTLARARAHPEVAPIDARVAVNHLHIYGKRRRWSPEGSTHHSWGARLEVGILSLVGTVFRGTSMTAATGIVFVIIIQVD